MLRSLRNLAEHRLEPIFDDSKPRDNHAVHHEKCRNKYLRRWHWFALRVRHKKRDKFSAILQNKTSNKRFIIQPAKLLIPCAEIYFVTEVCQRNLLS